MHLQIYHFSTSKVGLIKHGEDISGTVSKKLVQLLLTTIAWV